MCVGSLQETGIFSLSHLLLYTPHVSGDLDYVTARMTHARTHDGQWSTRLQPLSLPILIPPRADRQATATTTYLVLSASSCPCVLPRLPRRYTIVFALLMDRLLPASLRGSYASSPLCLGLHAVSDLLRCALLPSNPSCIRIQII